MKYGIYNIIRVFGIFCLYNSLISMVLITKEEKYMYILIPLLFGLLSIKLIIITTNKINGNIYENMNPNQEKDSNGNVFKY